MVWKITIVLLSWLLCGATDSWSFEPPSAAVEAIVTAAFGETHDGWSVDEMLLQDSLRGEFLKACAEKFRGEVPRTETEPTEDDFCAALLHLRKAGSRLPKSTRRGERQAAESVLTAAEIAARQLQDELDCHTDMILVDAAARAKFDEFAKSIAPDSDAYALRKAAIQLRKTRRLEPELLSRVTDWERTIREAPLADVRATLSTVSEGPGVYIFRDATGYLIHRPSREFARTDDSALGRIRPRRVGEVHRSQRSEVDPNRAARVRRIVARLQYQNPPRLRKRTNPNSQATSQSGAVRWVLYTT